METKIAATAKHVHYLHSETLDRLYSLPITGQGTAYEFHDNGMVSIAVDYCDGKPDGLLRQQRDDGTDQYIAYYKNGLKQGNAEFFNEDGLVTAREKYIDGQLVEYTTYHPNRRVKTCVSIENGEMHGTEETRNENGKLSSLVQYKKGRVTSAAIYHPNGRVKSEIPHEDDVPHGQQNIYNDKGIRVCQVRWEEGVKEGRSVLYKEDGNYIVIQYENDQRVGTAKEYNKDRKCVKEYINAVSLSPTHLCDDLDEMITISYDENHQIILVEQPGVKKCPQIEYEYDDCGRLIREESALSLRMHDYETGKSCIINRKPGVPSEIRIVSDDPLLNTRKSEKIEDLYHIDGDNYTLEPAEETCRHVATAEPGDIFVLNYGDFMLNYKDIQSKETDFSRELHQKRLKYSYN